MFNGRQVSVSEQSPNIAILKVFNPPFGFMDDLTEKELVQALDLLSKGSRINVVIVTGGQPDVFIKHYDTLVLEARARQMAARQLSFDTSRPVPEVGIHRVLREIESSDATFIAAINGTAMGGGYELALACDIRLAQAGNYQIGLPEVNLGLLPGAGGTQRLTRLIGQAKALELMLMGDTLSPRDAKAYGLVNDVVAGPVLDTAVQLAEVIASKPAKARAHIKRLIRSAQSGDPVTGFANERTLFCDLMVDPEAQERLRLVNGGSVSIHGERQSDAA